MFLLAKILKKDGSIKDWNNFCAMFVFFLTFPVFISAQLKDTAHQKLVITTQSLQNGFYSSQQNSQKPPVNVNFGNPFMHWGIICIGEYKMEKKTGIPLKLRLGSLEYVNKLEGKQ